MIRPSRVVDRHELAVEDRRSRVEPDGHPGQLRERRRHVAAVRVDDPDVARPGRSAGPTNAKARRPPQAGSNTWSAESKGSASGRGSIGRRPSGRFGSGWTSGSSGSKSWSRIVGRW